MMGIYDMAGAAFSTIMATVIFISAGEASGEQYGALLAASIVRQSGASGEPAQLFGMGGPRMEAAGVERIVRSEDMAVMGFTEVVLHLPRIYREFRKLKRAMRARRPDVAVLIDFPEIHFRLAKELHRLGVPVIYFVSPQLWAWKEHRIKLVREYVRRMLVIFPFEEKFYRDRGIEAEYVGHPLAELGLPAISREQFAAENHLDPMKTWIGLLPGSRLPEIKNHLPEMLEAARKLPLPDAEARPAELAEPYEFLIPLASTLHAEQRAAVQQMVQKYGNGVSVRQVDDTRAALLHSRAAVVASGTATVEAALAGNPFVVVYRVSALTYAIAKRTVKVPHVAMANLIAGKRVVPELIQQDFTAANIVQQLKRLLPDGPARESMRMELGVIRSTLRIKPEGKPGEAPGAIERVASIVLSTVQEARPTAVGAAQL
jgi:lipid-A-disaccharide synthase